VIYAQRDLITPATVFGVRVDGPEDDPDPITCPICGEDMAPRSVCVECANGERMEEAA